MSQGTICIFSDGTFISVTSMSNRSRKIRTKCLDACQHDGIGILRHAQAVLIWMYILIRFPTTNEWHGPESNHTRFSRPIELSTDKGREFLKCCIFRGCLDYQLHVIFISTSSSISCLLGSNTWLWHGRKWRKGNTNSVRVSIFFFTCGNRHPTCVNTTGTTSNLLNIKSNMREESADQWPSVPYYHRKNYPVITGLHYLVFVQQPSY